MKHADDTILDRLCRHARAQPKCTAFTFLNEEAAPECWTFQALERRVHRLAAHLCQHAVAGDRALLLYPPGLEFIAGFLACLAAGIVAVPAYPPRRNRSAERLRAILEDARPALVLTTRQIAPTVQAELLPSARDLALLVIDDIELSIEAAWHPPALTPDTLAFLQYTSGSTETPRGAMVTHGNLMHNEEVIQQAFDHCPVTGNRPSVMVSWLPPFHDMGLVGGILQPLYVGFPSVLLAPVTFLREPIRWLQAISDYRGTTSGAPNFAYDHCVKLITEEQKAGLDLSSWRIAYNGAEPVRAETLDRFARAFAGCGFRPQAFFPCYGLAEATLFVSGGPPDRGPTQVGVCGRSLEEHCLVEITGDDANTRPLVSCGRIAGETRAVIVDPETCTERQPGKIGEIWLASASVARGYWDRLEATQETFHARLGDTGEGPFLRTGDAGFVRDGELFITGRLKDLIILRGRNLYPQDIEAVVERTADFVKPNACAAFGVEAFGEERLAVVVEADRRLVQMALAAAKRRAASGAHETGNGTCAAAAELDDVVGRVRQAITEAFEVPVHTVAFVRPGTFPRTSSGKVQRRACRSGILAGTLDVVHVWQASGSTTGCPPALAADPQPLQIKEVGKEKVVEPRENGATSPRAAALQDVAILKGSAETSRLQDADAGNQQQGGRRPQQYTLENEHLQRHQRRHALFLAVAPLIGMGIFITTLWDSSVTLLDLGLLTAMYSLTFVGITVGFHRHFTHNAFKTAMPIRLLLAALGSMAAQAPLIYWVATHRRHHQFSDDDGDPHSPHLHGESLRGRLRGLWYAHMGWMYHHDTTNTSIYAKDLLREPAMRLMNRLYFPFILLGLAIPASIAAVLTGSWVGACQGLFWGGFCRIFLAHHFTWSVNSICHIYGRRDFDTHDHSVNNVWLAVPTLGESWHNNHHAFPSAATFSLRWWQLDLGAWLVRGLELVRLAWDVKEPRSEPRIQPGKQSGVPGVERPGTSMAASIRSSTTATHAPLVELKEVIHAKVLHWLRSEVDAAVETIDYDTSFMEVGIDSVGAASIALDIEKAIGERITPDVMYEHPTINRLAMYLAGRRVHGYLQPSAQTVSGPGEFMQTRERDRVADGPLTSVSKRQAEQRAALTNPVTAKKVRKKAADASCRETTKPTSSGAERVFPRAVSMLKDYSERNKLFSRLREEGRNFFGTPVSPCDGMWVEVEGRRMLMFSSYSYLGMIGHPEINDAVKEAIDTFGAGCHGARPIAGTTTVHRQVEQEIAAFLHAEDAAVYNTGYVTNLATIAALVGKDGCVIGDEYNHASIVDGCKFSGAKFLTFKHSNVGSLEEQLQRAGNRGKLVVVDGVYSMEGDVAPLPDIADLCDRYDALLMVDEAHSLGVLGATGRGIQEYYGLPPDAIDIKMGTLSKSLGGCGGYIAGKAEVIDYLKHAARGFVFSGAAPVPQMAAALKALQILRREPERVATLQRNTHHFLQGLRQLGFELTATQTPIVPILCGTEERTLEMTARCREEGLFLVPIIYPAVPMNAPRIRASVTAAHTDADIDRALDILGRVGQEMGLIA
jgi:8-amino-7-oxononanoate synthase